LQIQQNLCVLNVKTGDEFQTCFQQMTITGPIVLKMKLTKVKIFLTVVLQ